VLHLSGQCTDHDLRCVYLSNIKTPPKCFVALLHQLMQSYSVIRPASSTKDCGYFWYLDVIFDETVEEFPWLQVCGSCWPCVGPPRPVQLQTKAIYSEILSRQNDNGVVPHHAGRIYDQEIPLSAVYHHHTSSMSKYLYVIPRTVRL